MHIAVSSWSFHRSLYGGTMRLSDVPLAVYECGVRHVELNDLFLTPSQPGRLARLFGSRQAPASGPDYGRKSLMRVYQGRLRGGTRLACWTIETDLTRRMAVEQSAQRAYIATAIEAARFLGSPILRLTLGGESDDRSAVGRAVDMLRGVLPVAVASGMRLALENHDGLSSQAGVLEEVTGAFAAIASAGATAIGVCLDLGHFAEGDRQAGIARLAPLAIHVHAPARAFDERGEETTIDYRSAMQTLRKSGYDAAISVEYTGDEEPRESIRKTKALVERHWNG